MLQMSPITMQTNYEVRKMHMISFYRRMFETLQPRHEMCYLRVAAPSQLSAVQAVPTHPDQTSTAEQKNQHPKSLHLTVRTE